MGGYIAFEFLRRRPERIRALVLVNTRTPADSREAVSGRHEMADRVKREGTHVVADQMAQKSFSAEAADELRVGWRELMAITPPMGVATALRAMARRPDSSETLRTIDRPVLIIAGEEDRLIPIVDAHQMHELAPTFRLESSRVRAT